MSLNPVLSQDLHTSKPINCGSGHLITSENLLPLCEHGEAYVLSRPQTKVTLSLASRVLSGTGSVILTTHRLVFIKKQDENFKKGFSSINVPYSHLEKPIFAQPVFGTNHLKFAVTSDLSGAHPIESDGDFKLFFVSGGAELFLKMFFMFYARFRNNPNLMSSNNPITELEGDYCAFVDPGDPSQVYFTQPQTRGSPEGSKAGIQAAYPSQSREQSRSSDRDQQSPRRARWFRGLRAFAFLRAIR